MVRGESGLDGQQLRCIARCPQGSPSALSTPMPNAIVATTTCARISRRQRRERSQKRHHSMRCGGRARRTRVQHCRQAAGKRRAAGRRPGSQSGAPPDRTVAHPHFAAAPVVLHQHALLGGHACSGAGISGESKVAAAHPHSASGGASRDRLHTGATQPPPMLMPPAAPCPGQA